jgi:hypothetical protein
MGDIDHSVGEFYEERQYFSAWGARLMYYSSLDSIPDWQRDVMEAHRDYLRVSGQGDRSEFTVPLPTIESIGCLLYWMAGGEHVWLPRVFSALAWIVGGVFLYLLAKRLMTMEAALFATGFYLFLPTAILGSRSFQDEPLMIAAMICSIYTISLHDQKPTLRRALIAAVVAGVAILIRPLCAFMILGAFMALSIKRHGLRCTITDPHSWLFGGMTVLPTAALMIFDKFILPSGGMEIQGVLLGPQALYHLAGYYGWAYYLLGVIGSWGYVAWALAGIITFAAAVIGTIMLSNRRARARALVIGLWCGYVAFCVVSSRWMSNHHYHHLLIIPLIALCIGPIAVRILSWVYDSLVEIIRSRWVSRVVVGGILFVFVIFVLAVETTYMMRVAELGRERQVDAQTIGELVNHSTDVVVLSQGRGLDATYEGWYSGRRWLTAADGAMGGHDVVQVEATFVGMCQDWQPTYFVISYLTELDDNQPALKEFLSAKYPMVAQTDTYLIFDLRNSL